MAAAHALHLLVGHRAVAVRAEREERRVAVLEATRAAAARLLPAAAASHQHRDRVGDGRATRDARDARHA